MWFINGETFIEFFSPVLEDVHVSPPLDALPLVADGGGGGGGGGGGLGGGSHDLKKIYALVFAFVKYFN